MSSALAGTHTDFSMEPMAEPFLKTPLDRWKAVRQVLTCLRERVDLQKSSPFACKFCFCAGHCHSRLACADRLLQSGSQREASERFWKGQETPRHRSL